MYYLEEKDETFMVESVWTNNPVIDLLETQEHIGRDLQTDVCVGRKGKCVYFWQMCVWVGRGSEYTSDRCVCE